MKPPVDPFRQTAVRAVARTRAAAGRLWRRFRQQPETTVHEQIGSGALIGWGACIVFSWGASPLVMAVAALCGLCAGAAIGLLLWIGSAVTPDEKIAPPARSDQRTDRGPQDRRPPPET